MGIGFRIKEARENMNMSRVQLAELVNVTPSAISNYENEISSPKEQVLLALLKTLKVDANYLFQDVIDIKFDFKATLKEEYLLKRYRKLDKHSQELIEMILDKELSRKTEVKEESARYDTRQITYFDGPVSAGFGSLALDNPPSKMLNIPNLPEYANANYAVDMSGDSMEPTYADGSVLLIEITAQVQVGEIGIFWVDGEFFCKELGNGELLSHNNKYPPIKLTEDSKCMGRVVGVWEEL